MGLADKLRRLTNQTLKQQEMKSEKERQIKEERLSQVTEKAAKRGERQCIVMSGYNHYTYPTHMAYVGGLGRIFNPLEISPRVLPSVAKRVFYYCKHQGLKPRIDYTPPSPSAEKYEGWYSIHIQW